jgi:hypothetical protein
MVNGGRAIGRSGDSVCDLHRAHGDEELMFLGLASKLRLTSFPVWDSKSAASVW